MPLPYLTTSAARPVLFRCMVPDEEGFLLLERTPQGLRLPEVQFSGHGLSGWWCVEATTLLREQHGVDGVIRYVQEQKRDAEGNLEATLVVEVRGLKEGCTLETSQQTLQEVPGLKFWQQKGWFAGAEHWVHQKLPEERLEQHFTFEFSCLLGTGTHVLKATTALECNITRWLSRHHPHAVPAVLDTDPDQGLLLMKQVLGPLLVDVPKLEAWKGTLQNLARLQQHSTDHLAELRLLGVPDLEPSGFRDLAQTLLKDSVFLQAENLTLEQQKWLLEVRPALLDCISTLLTGEHITLIHGDFHPYNVISPGTISPGVIIDWPDVKIAHPFLDAAQCLSRLPVSLQNQRAFLREAYLEVWTGDPKDLEQQFEQASIVQRLMHAVKGHLMVQGGGPHGLAGFHLRGICQSHSGTLSSCGLPLPT